MKKVISIALVVIMTFVCSMAAFADAGLMANDSAKRSSTLSISGSTATCTSEYSNSNGNITKVEITQSLEKQGFLWMWDTVGEELKKTSSNSYVVFNNKVNDLDSGKYRVKTVFYVTYSSGSPEEITLYSDTKTVS